MQADRKSGAGEKKYKGCLDAYIKTIKTQGVRGLWTGVGPNIVRNSVINTAELATYDEAKSRILKLGLMNDNIACHLVSGLIAGFVATLVGSPVDVMKTRVMNAVNPDGSKVYKNVFDCMIKTLKNEGPFAFYKVS